MSFLSSIIALSAMAVVAMFLAASRGGASNAVLHPALALASRSYFPGLIASPLVGAGGAFLLRSLVRATRGEDPQRAT